jgi:hypothetical protein
LAINHASTPGLVRSPQHCYLKDQERTTGSAGWQQLEWQDLDTTLPVSGSQILRCKTEFSPPTNLSIMVASQCGNDRPGFGLHSITPGIECYNYKTY